MRIDLYLVREGYAESRSRAARLIAEGKVSVDGKTVGKSSDNLDEGSVHEVVITECERYVSRGGLKLEAALEAFGITVSGRICADIGASTGGFTDCLLQNGAKLVFAFDSGHGQLHPKIANDARVISREGFNARYIGLGDVTIEGINTGVDLAVMDVSFISQTYLIPALSEIIVDDGYLVSLIKPQFEAGRNAIGKNGIVKTERDREFAIRRVEDSAKANGFVPCGLIVSPIKGGDGNIEYLAAFEKTASRKI